ncbi:hypothetical protein [uncultured Bifidobacterium sp.]|uniref:hypothetical protein n=1 Tax=uncultured Bifidobacterium sp. TaxID=165187 RepID=UPI002619F172|nr:hypothetical protein [uncultured Bifidobacterium sp.]
MSANDLPINASYAKWAPNTRFKLLNVTWDMGYRDIVRFNDATARDKWMDAAEGVEFQGCTMAKYGLPVRLPLPFAQASRYNYLMAVNDYDFDTPRRWFYFVQTCEYVNAGTTQMNIQLDVWQTYQFDVTFGRCYVERGHVGVADKNQMADWGRGSLDLPEGLDTGSTTLLTAEHWHSLISGMTANDYGFGVLVISTTDLSQDGGDDTNPTVVTSSGSEFETQVNGTDVFYFPNPSVFRALMSLAGQSKPWMAQGIISIQMVPRLPDALLQNAQELRKFCGNTIGSDVNSYYRLGLPNRTQSARTVDAIVLKGFRSLSNWQIPERYKYLKKFFTAPYTWIECSCLNGTVITYEPQYIPSDDLTIREAFNYGPPKPRLNFYARGYHALSIGSRQPGPEAVGAPIDTGEGFNAAFGITDFPTFMGVNSGSALALANTAYTRAYQQQSADWAYQKTMMGVNNAYATAQVNTQYANQSTRLGNANRNAMNTISNNAAQMSTDLTLKNLAFNNTMNQINTIGSGIGNTVGNLISGKPGEALSSAVGATIGAVTNQLTYGNNVDTANRQLTNTQTTNNATTSQQNAYALASTGLSNRQTMQLADMNRSLASATAAGDYANTIAGINAQVQQTQVTPPTTVGALGGDSFNLANGIFGVMVRFRRIGDAAMRSIGEFWLRYGYYVQRFTTMPNSCMAMSNFTYWKVHELYLRSSTCPEEFRLTIRGIFESGVTVWRDPAKIGVTDYADNAPLDNITI